MNRDLEKIEFRLGVGKFTVPPIWPRGPGALSSAQWLAGGFRVIGTEDQAQAARCRLSRVTRRKAGRRKGTPPTPPLGPLPPAPPQPQSGP